MIGPCTYWRELITNHDIPNIKPQGWRAITTSAAKQPKHRPFTRLVTNQIYPVKDISEGVTVGAPKAYLLPDRTPNNNRPFPGVTLLC